MGLGCWRVLAEGTGDTGVPQPVTAVPQPVTLPRRCDAGQRHHAQHGSSPCVSPTHWLHWG